MNQTISRKTASREYYNRRHGNLMARWGYWKLDYRAIIAELARLSPGTLLDIGCGAGAFLEYAREALPGIRCTGMDLSEGMTREVRARFHGDVAAVEGDAEHMPFEGGSFEATTCNMSIHHYPHPQLAVREMFRVLKGGGHALINDMDCAAPIRYLANKCFPHLKSGDVKMYRRDEIESMLKEAGFIEIRYRKLTPFTFLCVAGKPDHC